MKRLLPFTFMLMNFINFTFAAEEIPPPPPLESSENSSVAQPLTPESSENSSIVPPLPDEPNENGSVTQPEKEVTIVHGEDAMIEEVRINGQLRYVKITPKLGKPYYMYDSNGDGILDSAETDIDKADVNKWILYEW